MNAAVDILDLAFIRMPCNVCGRTYDVPLRDILLSHTVVRCGCPVQVETECPPSFQIRLFEREPIKALRDLWQELVARARLDGGELVLKQNALTEEKQPQTGSEPMDDHRKRTNDGRIRQPVATSGPILNFDLGDEVRRMISEQPWQAEHTANTIVKYPDLRVVLVALKAGGRLHEHRTVGRLTIQCLSGDLSVAVDGRSTEVASGHLLTLDHDVPHEVEAKSGSVFLLTIAWPK